LAGEKLGQLAVNGSRISTSLALFVLESVQFSEDLEGDADVVITKIVEALGVVKENVGIENEVLTEGGGSLEPVAVSSVFPATSRFFLGFFAPVEHVRLDIGSAGSC
jgi:hypothetical protein